MITGKEELLQAMVEAFIMEKGTNEFYTEASGKANDAGVNMAFTQLAAWELEHMQYIQFLYSSIRDDRETLSFDRFREKVEPEEVEGGIPVGVIKEKLYKEGLDDIGVIAIAIEVEGKAYNLYRRLSETASDTNTREFMREMMAWEQKHLDYVKALRRTLSEGAG